MPSLVQLEVESTRTAKNKGSPMGTNGTNGNPGENGARRRPRVGLAEITNR